jgi:hypothetical protein
MSVTADDEDAPPLPAAALPDAEPADEPTAAKPEN